MGIFDEIQERALASFSGWIQVKDPKSNWTIEDFPYKTGVNEKIVKPHCVKCVAVNQCWFKNEESKKPEYFDYSKYSFSEIAKSKRGLYHPNCHCEEFVIYSPNKEQIKLIVPDGKVWWMFEAKLNTVLAYMGYTADDKEEILNLVFEHA